MPTPETSRINGAKGGRPKGRLSATEYEVRKAVRKSLRERCQENELRHVEELEWIAANSENHSARISAIGMLFDRGRGKPVQPHDGDGQGGPITFLVNTGVPEPELGEWQPVEPEVVAMPKPDVRPLPAVETVRLEEPEQGHSQPKTLQWHREG